jgi:serine/threonine protein kinase
MKCSDCQAGLPAEARFCLSCGARVEHAAPDAPVDAIFEALKQSIGFQYRIERLLGRGGMGAVYLAHELALDRDVAIKVLPPDQAGAAELRERYRREARTAARLNHPNIVPLHTFGEVSGLVYFVMGFVRGESLGSRIARQGPIEPEEARALLAGICDALDYAHRHGVVHRDLKPDNILIDAESGAPMLTDFGIAKASFSDAQLTTAGQLIGTPLYMSPEQASGRADIGARSDLYSLGVLGYEILSGRLPFEAANPMDAISQRLIRDPTPLASTSPGLPPDLTLAVDRCLERDPANRWPDARSLREALLPSDEEPEDTVAGRMLRIGVTMSILSIAALIYLLLFRALRPELSWIDRALRILGGASLSMMAFILIASIRLRAEGMRARGILLKALQQPRWWRSWYPPMFRRRGDQWVRLPQEIKRFRIYLGLLQVYVLTVFMPVQLLSIGSERLNTAQLAVFTIQLILMALTFSERRRAGRFISAKTGVTPIEASAIVSTPTWRATAWRRSPASTLLLGRATPAPVTVPAHREAATQASDSTRSDDATRLSS